MVGGHRISDPDPHAFYFERKSQVTQGVLELANCLPLLTKSLGLYSLEPTGLAHFNTFEVMIF